MGQFSFKLDAEGLSYTINHSWWNRIRSQSGFAPLEHITTIESVKVRFFLFWSRDHVFIHVDGEDFVYFAAPPYQSHTLVQELKKQLAALRSKPS